MDQECPSPLRDGEPAPQVEGPDTPGHQHAVDVSGISTTARAPDEPPDAAVLPHPFEPRVPIERLVARESPQ
jgi:hypothetical protein